MRWDRIKLIFPIIFARSIATDGRGRESLIPFSKFVMVNSDNSTFYCLVGTHTVCIANSDKLSLSFVWNRKTVDCFVELIDSSPKIKWSDDAPVLIPLSQSTFKQYMVMQIIIMKKTIHVVYNLESVITCT